MQSLTAPQSASATLAVPDGVDAALTAVVDWPCAQVLVSGAYSLTLTPLAIGTCTLTISNGTLRIPFTLVVQ